MVYDNSIIILIFASLVIPFMIWMMFDQFSINHKEIEIDDPHLVISEPMLIPDDASIIQVESPSFALPDSLEPHSKKVLTGFCYRTNTIGNTNLNEMSCDCEHWLLKRSKFDKKDARRLCGHLCDVVTDVKNYVSNGYGIEEELFPLPAYSFLISTYKVNENLVQIMSHGRNPWVDVIAKNRYKKPIYQRFGYHLNDKRWSFGKSPHLSPLIKVAISMHRVEFLETDFDTLPEVPQNALEKHNRNLEQIKNEENYHKKYPHLCYVCKSPIDAKEAKPLIQEIICQYCGKSNVVVPCGNVNTPERVALYNKYDGTYSNDFGSIGRIENHKEKQLRIVKNAYKNKKLSEESFKKKIKFIKNKAANTVSELEKQKEEELKEIKKVESIHRQKVIKV